MRLLLRVGRHRAVPVTVEPRAGDGDDSDAGPPTVLLPDVLAAARRVLADLGEPAPEPLEVSLNKRTPLVAADDQGTLSADVRDGDLVRCACAFS